MRVAEKILVCSFTSLAFLTSFPSAEGLLHVEGWYFSRRGLAPKIYLHQGRPSPFILILVGATSSSARAPTQSIRYHLGSCLAIGGDFLVLLE